MEEELMRKTLCAALLIAIGSYMAPASAVTVTSTTSLGDLTGTTANIFNTFGAPGVGGLSFIDTYNFDLSLPSQSLGTTVTFQISLGSNSLALSNMVITLMDSSLNTLGSDSQIVSGNTLSLSAMLGAGTAYHFVVTGDVTGSLGGSYSGLIAAVPVPEAKTYALMLAGLALVGFMARRNAHLSA